MSRAEGAPSPGAAPAEAMNVCVFCGSSPGADPVYLAMARTLGKALGEGGHGLVYGGAGRGLMGALADAALEAGAPVAGVLPKPLFRKELAHPGLHELVVVRSMHERKAEMAERADAFLVLPGGLGTLDETFEVLSWAQLGIHRKPAGLLNVRGYFDHLLAFLDHACAQAFVTQEHRELLVVETDVGVLLERLAGRMRRPAAGNGLDLDDV